MAQCSGYGGYRKITRSSNLTAERSCPCKRPACPAIGGGSEVTFKPLVPRAHCAKWFRRPWENSILSCMLLRMLIATNIEEARCTSCSLDFYYESAVQYLEEKIYMKDLKEISETLSRVCGLTGNNKLINLHLTFVILGFSRMAHCVRSRNLPYFLKKIKKMSATCSI
ncbi:hypothetical protein J6590_013080 [Homalodisca vitripennis]|nr:hypothetical protein J6590_013080 [Homalodisca vitripennis]